MMMPFGRYKGTEISDLPRPYIQWLNDNVVLYGRVKGEVEAILKGEETMPNKSFEEILAEMDFSGAYE
jgi:hypothetical protein